MTNAKAKRSVTHWLTVLILSGVALGSMASSGRSESANLAGSWSGGGWVSLADGSREKAHCSLHYSPAGGSQYSISATCASDSGKVSQTGRVHKSGENSYQGSFYNSEFDVHGQIRVVMNGSNKQTVTLTSDSANARLTLSR